MLKYLHGIVALALVHPVIAGGQRLSSPFATVSQKVDSTTITIEYSRPSARGRTIFGGLVRWRDVWTPGANWATTLEVNRDIQLEGKSLPRGKYSLWFITAPAPSPWTVVLNKSARRFHVVRPDPKEDQLRFDVRPGSGPHLEMLTFSFPMVTREAATIEFHWAGTVLPIKLEVERSDRAVAAGRPLSSYVGVYELRWEDSPNPVRFEIIERSNGLWVRTTAEAVEPGLDTEFDLLPIGGDEFHPRQYQAGKLIGDEHDEVIVFHFDGSRATGFDLHGKAEAKILAKATRAGR